MTEFYKQYNILYHLQILDKGYAGKKDKAGLPIWLHALRMAQVAYQYQETAKSQTIMTALYHDYLEDALNPEILKDIVSEDVYTAVEILTRTKDETYMEYITKIIDSKNRLAMTVKKLDLHDHIVYSDSISKSLLQRYEKALDLFYRKGYII
tara:strand:+ start:1345 stop:1800 length:456 start_codon:yes stop_codon:yes gene_type:complete